MNDVERWLVERMKGVPDEFRPWLEPNEETNEGSDPPPRGGEDAPESAARDLEHRGLLALRRASRAPGRNRESAFHLLAADAHLTWSAEAHLESPDPGPELRSLLRRVVAEGR